jgi:hypothetical protein
MRTSEYNGIRQKSYTNKNRTIRKLKETVFIRTTEQAVREPSTDVPYGSLYHGV